MPHHLSPPALPLQRTMVVLAVWLSNTAALAWDPCYPPPKSSHELLRLSLRGGWGALGPSDAPWLPSTSIRVLPELSLDRADKKRAFFITGVDQFGGKWRPVIGTGITHSLFSFGSPPLRIPFQGGLAVTWNLTDRDLSALEAQVDADVEPLVLGIRTSRTLTRAPIWTFEGYAGVTVPLVRRNDPPPFVAREYPDRGLEEQVNLRVGALFNARDPECGAAVGAVSGAASGMRDSMPLYEAMLLLGRRSVAAQRAVQLALSSTGADSLPEVDQVQAIRRGLLRAVDRPKQEKPAPMADFLSQANQPACPKSTKDSPPTRRALVVGGGGAKGAFAVGVLSILDSAGWTPNCFHVFAGTSTGALVVPLVHDGALRELTRFYTQVSPSDLLTQHPALRAFLFEPGFMDTRRLRNFLLDHYMDSTRWKRIESDTARPIIITAVNLQDKSLAYYYTGRVSNTTIPTESGYRFVPVTSREQMLSALFSSGSEPVLTPPVLGHDLQQYVDGGIRVSTPILAAMVQDVQEVWVIALGPPLPSPTDALRPRDVHRYDKSIEVLARLIDVLTTHVTETDFKRAELIAEAAVVLRRLNALDSLLDSDEERRAARSIADSLRAVLVLADPKGTRRFSELQLNIIRPSLPLPGASLENTVGDQKRMYLIGQEHARAFLRSREEKILKESRPGERRLRVYEQPEVQSMWQMDLCPPDQKC